MLAAWLLLWYLAARWVDLPVLLPGPIETLRTLFRLAGGGAFWRSLGQSLARIGLGFLLAILLGSVLAVLCAFSAGAQAFLSPLKTLIRSTPVSSFIILVLLWIDVDRVPLFIAMLTVLPIIWQNVQEGILQTDSRLLEMGRAYALGRMKVLRHIYVPSIRPYFYAACATALGFAWKSAIAAEVIAKPLFSIGRNLQDAKVYLNTEELFAWTLAIVLMSLLLELLLRWTLGLRKEGKGA